MEVLGRREDGSEGERIKMRKRKGLMRERQARGETKQYEQGSRQGEGSQIHLLYRRRSICNQSGETMQQGEKK
jgi:hypothetical protein